MPELNKDITTKLDEALVAMKAAQNRADVLEKDGIDAEYIKKASADAVSALEQVTKMKDELKAKEDDLKNLEKQLYRMPNGSQSKEKELTKKYYSALDAYVRKGNPMDAELYKNVCESFVSKNIYDETKHKEMVSNAIDERGFYLEPAFEAKKLAVTPNDDGGFWVSPQRLTQMVTRTYETSPMRNYASVVTTASDSVELIVDDGQFTSGGWVSEKTTRSETETGKIGLLSIYAHAQYAEPGVTSKLLQDAGFDVVGYINRRTNDILSRTENTAFVSGTGVGQPKGFLSYAAWSTPSSLSGTVGVYEKNKLEQINIGSASTFTADGLKLVQGALKEEYQGGAIWMIKRLAFQDIVTLKDGQGRYLLNVNSIAQGDNKILLGKPVAFANDMPIIASDALAIAYGDFGIGYTVVDKAGTRLIRDEITDKTQVSFYTEKRTGGALTSYESIKLGKIAA